MSTFYKGDSQRVKPNGYAGNIDVVCGKFCGVVHEEQLRAIEASEPSEPNERFGCIVAFSSQCWGYATESDALAAGAAYMIHNGFTPNKTTAIAEATRLAKARHAAQCAKSSNYTRHYE